MPFLPKVNDTEFEIKSMPMPKGKRRVPAEIYPFHAMEPGSNDSFDLGCKEGDATNMGSRIRGNAKRNGYKVMVREVKPTLVRVWRVK